MTKVSYLVSTYDSGHFLDRHMADLIDRQTDPDFEIVIVNPDSPGTDDIIARKWEIQDPRVKYIFYEKREPYGASWLRAWEAATGDFVMNSNTDDYHEPHTTETVFKHMKLAVGPLGPPNKIGFGYGGLTIIDESGRVKGRGLKPPFDFELMTRECWAGPQVIWRNDKEFRDSLNWEHLERRASVLTSGFDYGLWLYFMSLGYYGHVIQDFITIYTQRPDSLENSNKWLNNWDTFVSIAEYFPHHFETHLKKHQEFVERWPQVPDRTMWSDVMRQGKKWRNDYGWQEME